MPQFSLGLCSVINLVVNWSEIFFAVSDLSKLAKTRSILNSYMTLRVKFYTFSDPLQRTYMIIE